MGNQEERASDKLTQATKASYLCHWHSQMRARRLYAALAISCFSLLFVLSSWPDSFGTASTRAWPSPTFTKQHRQTSHPPRPRQGGCEGGQRWDRSGGPSWTHLCQSTAAPTAPTATAPTAAPVARPSVAAAWSSRLCLRKIVFVGLFWWCFLLRNLTGPTFIVFMMHACVNQQLAVKQTPGFQREARGDFLLAPQNEAVGIHSITEVW